MDVHLTDGFSAAQSLRQAFRNRRKVFALDDLPQFGPLHDGKARAAYFDETLALREHFGDDAFARWRSTVRDIQALRPERVLVWVSRSGADIIFLSMVAHFFAHSRLELWEVRAPPLGGIEGVGLYPEDRLALLLPSARRMDQAELTRLESDFQNYSSRSEHLRIADRDGVINFHREDYFDNDILDIARGNGPKPRW